jgi:hypothetical protein
MDSFSESTLLRYKTVTKNKKNLITSDNDVKEVVKDVMPEFIFPTHTCFGVFNAVCNYFLYWYYKLPSLDINACKRK